MNEYVIETKNLTKQFSNFTAVNKINLKVEKGQIYGFLGPNGAGKSTTIRMLLGLIKPTEGKSYLFGKPMESHSINLLRKVGSMVESPSYYGNLTAKENLEITRKILDADKKEIDKVLKIVDLTKWKNERVKKFSLGMKQRLGIAQALLGNKELLILDEPTNGLDPSGIHEIRDLIISLPEMLGVTVLISSHILSEVELMATQVGIINKGELLFEGPLRELKNKNQSEICIGVSPISEAERYLLDKNYEVDKKNDRLFLKKEDLNPGLINKELVFQGFEVSHISEENKSLENIFLELTGGIK
ncbi:ABC transporter ATP-binding protein [Tissierella carlieri]|jgi:ABC-type multidrug transport system ATPase subunit|uniref:ABC transporter ATP-binding protein n=1 Tax=Tissierella TaxID=41273 RepID=UPI000B9FC37B|nr:MULTISPECIES: ABC transporter ATP-binding protein [Tissierella]MBU5311241.1 ABC transporter ATP-binding protein [Tissierella carlieri]MDU5081671.1 ABC transporter ATP-binding protein [Bacillota bacterium]OZV11761.1 bacitracin ABC transporter ATP-binding protein [Tissierella sp. P1]